MTYLYVIKFCDVYLRHRIDKDGTIKNGIIR